MKSKDLFEGNVDIGSSSNSQFFKTYEDTKNWLDEMAVENYKINEDTLVVDVDGSVNLTNKNIRTIPVKFGKVAGWFYVHDNQNLESLIGTPYSSYSLRCKSIGIKNFNGLGRTDSLFAYDIQSLESFEGLPNEFKTFDIANSCHSVESIAHFPKIITDYLCIGSDFKWFDSLYKHMELCNAIVLDGDIGNYNSILKLLYINGIKRISINLMNRPAALLDILNAEIRRQPDPRKRNLLKVAQELSNAGFHHLTV